MLTTHQGRRDCDFSTNPGPNSCLDGGCNGGLECDIHTGTVSGYRVIQRLKTEVIRTCRASLLLLWLSSPSKVLGSWTTTMVRLYYVSDPYFHLSLTLSIAQCLWSMGTTFRCVSLLVEGATSRTAPLTSARTVSPRLSRHEIVLSYLLAPHRPLSAQRAFRLLRVPSRLQECLRGRSRW